MIYTYKLLEKRLPKDLCKIINSYLYKRDDKYKKLMVKQINEINQYVYYNKLGINNNILNIINFPKKFIKILKKMRESLILKSMIQLKNIISYDDYMANNGINITSHDNYCILDRESKQKLGERKNKIKEITDLINTTISSINKNNVYRKWCYNKKGFFHYLSFFKDFIKCYEKNNSSLNIFFY